jgi:3-polyprenyl-4-hydroxybenzoate decarboxylase
MREKVGQLKSVKAGVDRDLEIPHVSEIVEEKHPNA